MATDHKSSLLETAASWHQNLLKIMHQLQDHASSALSLTAQWKQFEDHLQFTQHSLQERAEEVESTGRLVLERYKELEEKEKRLELMERSITEKSEELQAREAEFVSFQISATRERQEDIDWVEKMSEELKSAKLRYVRQQEVLEDWGNRLELFSRDIDEELKRKQNLLKLKEDSFEQEVKDFEARKRQFEEKNDQLLKSKKEERFEQELQDLEANKKKFERRVRGFNSTKKKTEDWSKELDSRDRELGVRARAVDLKKKELEKQSKELELKEKSFQERLEELELKEKQYEKPDGKLELEEKNLSGGNQQSPEASAKRTYPTTSKTASITTDGRRGNKGSSSGTAAKSHELRQRRKKPRYFH